MERNRSMLWALLLIAIGVAAAPQHRRDPG
jgi:hypothetical protein